VNLGHKKVSVTFCICHVTKMIKIGIFHYRSNLLRLLWVITLWNLPYVFRFQDSGQFIVFIKKIYIHFPDF